MNAFEGKAGMVYLKAKLCYPCLLPERFEMYIVYKRRYINTPPFFLAILLTDV